MPPWLPPDAQDLIRRMLEVNPDKRILVRLSFLFFLLPNELPVLIESVSVQMEDIQAHPWMTRNPPRAIYGQMPPAPPDVALIARPVGSREDVDPEILQNLKTLWQGAKEDNIVRQLLTEE